MAWSLLGKRVQLNSFCAKSNQSRRAGLPEGRLPHPHPLPPAPEKACCFWEVFLWPTSPDQSGGKSWLRPFSDNPDWVLGDLSDLLRHALPATHTQQARARSQQVDSELM